MYRAISILAVGNLNPRLVLQTHLMADAVGIALYEVDARDFRLSDNQLLERELEMGNRAFVLVSNLINAKDMATFETVFKTDSPLLYHTEGPLLMLVEGMKPNKFYRPEIPTVRTKVMESLKRSIVEHGNAKED